MLSYWEERSFSHYDHIVVGAGIVGLNAGIELKERFPTQSVLVLERGLLPTGASTRNAGFACLGSLTELLDDMKYAKESQVVQLFEWRKSGLDMLRQRLGDAPIGYSEKGSYELISEKDADAMGNMEYVNWILKNITGKPTFKRCDDKIEASGFSKSYAVAMLENTCEGELHTGKLMRALTELATKKGVEIKTGAEVEKFEESEGYVSVFTTDAFRKERIVFTCGTMSVCTNAYAKQLLPDVDVVPGRGQCLITEPIAGLKFKGIYHFDKGYFYFRELDGRILIGGGRNLDIKGETTTDMGTSTKIQAALEEKLSEIVIPGQKFEVAQRWSGIMGFGATKRPVIQQFSNRTFGAFRMGGMGIALGSYCAREMVSMM